MLHALPIISDMMAQFAMTMSMKTISFAGFPNHPLQFVSRWPQSKSASNSRDSVLSQRGALGKSAKFMISDANIVSSSTDENAAIALLIGGNNKASQTRLEHMTRILTSGGFEVRLVETCPRDPATTSISDTELRERFVFDVSGQGGHALLHTCEEAGVAALYIFKSATGMFRKVRRVSYADLSAS